MNIYIYSYIHTCVYVYVFTYIDMYGCKYIYTYLRALDTHVAVMSCTQGHTWYALMSHTQSVTHNEQLLNALMLL